MKVFYMRLFLYSLLVVLFSVHSASAEDGWPRSKTGDPRGLTRSLTGKQAGVVLRLVGNLPWLPDNDKSVKDDDKQKYLYVIYTPTCSFSQEFYESTRKLADKVQIRWIPVDPDGSVNSMYEQRDAKTVRNAFKTSQVPPDKDRKTTANINTYNMAGISYLLVSQIISPDQNLYFPTLIYGAPEKVSISIGPVKNINQLITNLPMTSQPQQPEAISLGAIKPEIIAISPSSYVNKGKERVALRLVPDSRGIEVGGILAGEEWPRYPFAALPKTASLPLIFHRKAHHSS